MSIVAIALIVIALVALLLSIHFGPHAVVVVSGAVTAVSSLAIVLIGAGLLFATDPLIAFILLSIALVGSAATLLWGYRSIRSNRAMGSSVDLDRLRVSLAVALTDLTPNGIVRIDGEQWSAESIDGTITAGTPVLVSEVRGLRVIVVADPLSTEQTSVAHKSKES